MNNRRFTLLEHGGIFDGVVVCGLRDVEWDNAHISMNTVVVSGKPKHELEVNESCIVKGAVSFHGEKTFKLLRTQ